MVERGKEVGRTTRELTQPINITKFGIYNAIERFGDRLWLITLANERSMIIRAVEIEPVTDEEKKYPMCVPNPVIPSRWMDCPWDPRGVSICDILEDKQTALQLFDNLEKIRAEYATWGQYFFYDPDLVKDVKMLAQQSL